MGGKQSQESPSSSPELDRNRPHHHHSSNSNAATWHHREQGLDNSSALVFHPLSQSYPHRSHHRHRGEDTPQGGPSSSSTLTHSHSHRSRDRRAYQYSHPRPDYVDLDFTMPSLDQRLVPRPRSVTGTHDTGIGRRHRMLSSSAPANSILFVRPLSSKLCTLDFKFIVRMTM